jgi:glycerol-3-phosphate dehydrogenase
MVIEALKERGYLFKNAPHLVKNLTFNIPVYSFLDKIIYFIGLYIYEFLAGKYSFGPSRLLSKNHILQDIPTLNPMGLAGGIAYQDGQFDDSRLAIELMKTSADHGGVLINYAEVQSFKKDDKGNIVGLNFFDSINKKSFEVEAKTVINATGVFADDILQIDEPGKKQTVVASQGSHIIVDKKFLPGTQALMIPKTSDSRVLFAIPWHNTCLIGTTDLPVNNIDIDTKPLDEEIEFILATAQQYMDPAPVRSDILSAFSGLRPLAAPSGESKNTKEISRSHKINVSNSGLVNIIGGKWTTYRKMAEDTVDMAARTGRLIHSESDKLHAMEHSNPRLKEKIHPSLPYTFSEIEWAIKEEMAITLEDVLARRTRSILLNAKASIEAAPGVASFMAEKLNHDNSWIDEQLKSFERFAKGYII